MECFALKNNKTQFYIFLKFTYNRIGRKDVEDESLTPSDNFFPKMDMSKFIS